MKIKHSEHVATISALLHIPKFDPASAVLFYRWAGTGYRYPFNTHVCLQTMEAAIAYYNNVTTPWSVWVNDLWEENINAYPLHIMVPVMTFIIHEVRLHLAADCMEAANLCSSCWAGLLLRKLSSLFHCWEIYAFLAQVQDPAGRICNGQVSLFSKVFVGTQKKTTSTESYWKCLRRLMFNHFVIEMPMILLTTYPLMIFLGMEHHAPLPAW